MTCVSYFFPMSSPFIVIKKKLRFSTSATFLQVGKRIYSWYSLVSQKYQFPVVFIACSSIIRVMLIVFITYVIYVNRYLRLIILIIVKIWDHRWVLNALNEYIKNRFRSGTNHTYIIINYDHTCT